MIKETLFQKQDRLDREFEALVMGNRTHAQFWAQFEAKLCEVAEAKISVVNDPPHLYRKYLSKLTQDLRATVLSKTWLLEGDQAPACKPTTWVEVATAVELELETRAGSKAMLESLFFSQDQSGASPTAVCEENPEADEATMLLERKMKRKPLESDICR